MRLPSCMVSHDPPVRAGKASGYCVGSININIINGEEEDNILPVAPSIRGSIDDMNLGTCTNVNIHVSLFGSVDPDCPFPALVGLGGIKGMNVVPVQCLKTYGHMGSLKLAFHGDVEGRMSATVAHVCSRLHVREIAEILGLQRPDDSVVGRWVGG